MDRQFAVKKIIMQHHYGELNISKTKTTRRDLLLSVMEPCNKRPTRPYSPLEIQMIVKNRHFGVCNRMNIHRSYDNEHKLQDQNHKQLEMGDE